MKIQDPLTNASPVCRTGIEVKLFVQTQKLILFCHPFSLIGHFTSQRLVVLKYCGTMQSALPPVCSAVCQIL
jgi:hypothetical protein